MLFVAITGVGSWTEVRTGALELWREIAPADRMGETSIAGIHSRYPNRIDLEDSIFAPALV